MARCMLTAQSEQPSSLLLAWSATYSHAELRNTLRHFIWPGQLARMWALPPHMCLEPHCSSKEPIHCGSSLPAVL